MTSAGDISRRAAIGALAAGAGAFALFGPRSDRDKFASRGKLVLDYWEKWTGVEGQAMQKIVDAFNASQNRLYVRYLITNSIHQKALIAILGGAAPDIVGLYAENVPSYTESNAVLPLEDLAAAAGIKMSDYAPGMHQVMRQGGRWSAIINTCGTLALYWNRAIFRECGDALRKVGLSPDEPPKTIDELDLAHQATTKVAGGAAFGKGPLERMGFMHLEPGWWSWIWGQPFGGTILREGNAVCGEPDFVRGYDWVQSYTEQLGVDYVETFRSGFGPYGTPQCAFLTGKVAMCVQGPWMANLIHQFTPDLDYGVTPIPTIKSLYDPAAPLAVIDTDVMMIPRGCKDPKASMEFIAFTQRPENVEALASAHCKGSPLVKVSESFFAHHKNRGVRLHTALASSPRAFTSPRVPQWPEWKDTFDTAMQDLWKHADRAKPRMEYLQRRGQALLDEAAGRRALRGEAAGNG
ncbi:MAG: extracellular solute-binding protein [Phycisphaerales bacterium]|jgi:ABC-type glycerol-3-phosphate transport system substrate-binding protein